VNCLNSMEDTKRSDIPVVNSQLALCRHLRSAGMYVFSDESRDETADNYDSSSYWCSETMKNFGPDDDMVGGRECRDPSRSCHQPL
jgi:hypothetical protein